MAHIIDLSTYGPQLKKVYDSILSSDPDVSWAVFNYAAGDSQALKPIAQGAGDLDEFVEEFDDGKVQYGFVRVDFDNRPKYVLVGWVGEGVPDRTKGYFNAHYSTIAKYFPGYHIQITARSSADLTPQIINQKVIDSSGSKYGGLSKATKVTRAPKYTVASDGAAEEDWGSTPQVKQVDGLNKVQTAYKPMKVSIAALRANASEKSAPPKAPASNSGLDNSTASSYKPIGKVDIAALRAAGKDSKFNDDGPPPLQSSYKPIGKVDIAAIRAAASTNKKSEPEPEPEPVSEPVSESESIDSGVDSTPQPSNLKDRLRNFQSAAASTNDDDESQDEAPKSIKDRINAYKGSGRLEEMPKRTTNNAVSSRFNPGSAASRGTAPSLPSYQNLGFKKSEPSNPGFLDAASQGGKTPAQLWAEKHGKVAPAIEPTSEPEVSPYKPVEEPEEEHTSVRDITSQFGSTSIEEDRNESSASTTSFADLTSKFAAKNAKDSFSAPPPAPAAAPAAEPESEPEPEPVSEAEFEPKLPQRSVPPAPQVDEDEEVAIPVAVAKEEDLTPPPPARPVEVEEEASALAPVAEEPSDALTAIVIFDYSKDEDNEIDLVADEKITEIVKVDEDWWLGTNSQGQSGLFPASYVELTSAEPVSAAEPDTVSSTNFAEPIAAAATPSAVTASSDQPRAVAAYSYTAGEDGELSFEEGDLIEDIVFEDEGWWSGVLNGGERGLFPANYVELQS